MQKPILLRPASLACLMAILLMLSTIHAEPASAPGLSAPDKEKAEKVFSAKPPYSPYADRNFPTRPFFGDTHLQREA